MHLKASCSALIVRRVVVFSALLVLTYAFYVGLAYTQQKRLLFPATSRLGVLEGETTQLNLVKAKFDTTLGEKAGFAWYLPPPIDMQPAPAIIIGHGSEEIADDWVGRADQLRQKGFGVLILGYPGYGHATGSPSKASIIEASVAGYDWLVTQPGVKSDEIILFGHSLGAATALPITEQRPTKEVILLSAFASIEQVARDRYLPAFLAHDQFDNASILAKYEQPAYIIHGTMDRLIPPHHAVILHEAALNSELHWVECRHDGCVGDINIFWDDIEPKIREMIAD